MTSRGYVSTYDAYFATPDGEGGIIVSLTYGAAKALSAAAALVDAVDGDDAKPLNPDAKPFHLPEGII